jgi:HlyD family secretion protein
MSSKNSKSSNSNLIVAFVVLLVIIVVITLVGAFVMKPDPEIIEGEVEVDEMRISSKVPARISRFCVKEGDNVKVGDTLVVLDSPEIEAKLQQAMAAEAAAAAVSDKAKNGAREEQIRGAYEIWQKAKAGQDVAKKSYDRVQSLFNKGVLPAQKRDEVEAQYKAAVATAQAAKSQYDMAINGAQKEDKEAAAAQVSRAQGAIAEVKSYLKETVLFAPINGKISDIFPLRGELVGSGSPIMNLQDMSSCWVTFNVREKDYQRMSEGKIIDAFIPALNNKAIKLKIRSAKDLGSFAAWKATKMRGEYDSKTFEIKADPVEHVDGLIPGMTVVLK